MKTAIVTGANGFIGKAVTTELLNHGYYVYAICRSIPEEWEKPIENFTCIECGLNQLHQIKEVIPNNSNALFYHFAWQGASGEERANYSLQLKNAEWTINALKIAKEIGCCKFIGAGSIMEHETIAAISQDGNRPGLGYIYGTAKFAAHSIGKSVASALDINFIWPLITNTYGINEVSPRLVNTTIKKCILGIAPEFTSGTQNYDFIYISDVAEAFRLIGEKGKPFHNYIIGSGNPRPLKDFLLEMQERVASNIPFKFGDIPFTGVNLNRDSFISKNLERDTGFHPSISFSDGCQLTYNWWKHQLEKND